MIMEALFSLHDGSIISISVGTLATLITFIYFVNRALNKKFDEKADKLSIDDDKKMYTEKFKELNERINLKADQEAVKNIKNDLTYIRGRIDDLFDKHLKI